MKRALLLLSFAAGLADADRYSFAACPRGQVYSACGTSCEKTCESILKPPKSCPLACKEGCFCPEETPVRLADGSCGVAEQCTLTNPSENDEKCLGDLVWNECGSSCDSTCQDPSPLCVADCIPKCECPRDKPILLPGNKCGTLEACAKCTGDLKWNECGSACEPTCANPDPICIALCVPKCECPKETPFRLSANKCGTAKECPPRQEFCPKNMIWNECGSSCTPTCSDPNPVCSMQCLPRCECPKDLPILLPNGTCGSAPQCTSTRGDCPGNLVWNECGQDCEPTCNDPFPICPAACVQKCECPKDLPIRLSSGTCVSQQQCKEKPVNRCYNIRRETRCKKAGCNWRKNRKVCTK